MSSQWRVAEPDAYGCRLWQGRLDKDGYPVVWSGGRLPVRVYRLAYEERHGPIPEGMEIEHACRRRACMTDAHHLLVSRRDNERLKRWRARVKISRCANGHSLELHGVVTPEGGRVCRICSRAEKFFGPPENWG